MASYGGVPLSRIGMDYKTMLVDTVYSTFLLARAWLLGRMVAITRIKHDLNHLIGLCHRYGSESRDRASCNENRSSI